MRLITAALAAIAAAAALSAGSLAATHVAPSITSFKPKAVKAGAKITIVGKNFTGAKSVMLGGTKLTFKVVSAKDISATVSAKAKTGTLTVTTKGGKATSATTLTVS